MMDELYRELASVLDRIPEWAGRTGLALERVGGLTNANYRVTADGEEAFLRVSRTNVGWLGVDRQLEREALAAASTIGVGPEVLHFLLPEGHMVTRAIAGREWTFEEYATPKTLARVVATVKRVHALPPVRAVFSPFRRIERYAAHARAFGVPMAADLPRVMARLGEIEAEQLRDPERRQCVCHNDLYAWNFLDDGSVRLLDWEFAGMDDPYFDLATLVYSHDSEGPLPGDLQDELLRLYFGAATPPRRSRLRGMLFALNLFTAMWGYLHAGLQRAGELATVEGFDYLEYAESTLGVMRTWL